MPSVLYFDVATSMMLLGDSLLVFRLVGHELGCN